MKKLLAFLGTFTALLVGSLAFADESYLCTHKQDSRAISVVYPVEHQKLPCEVHYSKNGDNQVLWRSSHTVGFCSAKAEEFVAQQVAWGWNCGEMASEQVTPKLDNTSPSETSPDTVVTNSIATDPTALTPEQVDAYHLQARFSQALATANNIRMLVSEHWLMNAEYPKNLADLGYSAEQMRDSSAFAELKVVDGQIRLKGNEALGKRTAILLTPKVTLAGNSMEWICTTNTVLIDQKMCQLDDSATF